MSYMSSIVWYCSIIIIISLVNQGNDDRRRSGGAEGHGMIRDNVEITQYQV